MSLAKLVIGNWKMNGSEAMLREFAQRMQRESAPCGAAVCVPSTLLWAAQSALRATPLRWGAQDCCAHDAAASTGDVSAEMIAAFGTHYVIVGHSERRIAYGETDGLIAEKARRVLAAGMTPIVCVGETTAERDGNQTQTVLRRQVLQLARTVGPSLPAVVIAYEPVWAIGSGDAAAPGLIDDTLGFIEQILHFHAGVPVQAVRVLYGGSVNPRNAGAILSRRPVAGVLVGGASLRAADFVEICRAAGRCADADLPTVIPVS